MNRGARRVTIAVAAVAVTVGATLIGVSAVSGDSQNSSSPITASAPGVEPRGIFDGVPQHGIVLGSLAAPVTLVEFADPQCPYCAEFANVALPTLVGEYVRTGRVKLVFEGLAFLGADSGKALRAVLAAGLQNHAWDVLHSLYGRQGTENSGWVTRALLREVANNVRGLDASRMLRESTTVAVTRLVAEAKRFAREGHVSGTPTFFVGRSGAPLRRVQLTSLRAEAFRPALDAELAR